MINLTKKIANYYNDYAMLTSCDFAHKHRKYIPTNLQKLKRLLRKKADRKESRLILKEVRNNET